MTSHETGRISGIQSFGKRKHFQRKDKVLIDSDIESFGDGDIDAERVNINRNGIGDAPINFGQGCEIYDSDSSSSCSSIGSDDGHMRYHSYLHQALFCSNLNIGDFFMDDEEFDFLVDNMFAKEHFVSDPNTAATVRLRLHIFISKP